MPRNVRMEIPIPYGTSYREAKRMLHFKFLSSMLALDLEMAHVFDQDVKDYCFPVFVKKLSIISSSISSDILSWEIEMPEVLF